MVKKAHSLGLQAGFYINNCICGENQWRGNATWEAVVYEGTAKAILAWGFDGVKIDSCSEFTNMTRWAELFAASGKVCAPGPPDSMTPGLSGVPLR